MSKYRGSSVGRTLSVALVAAVLAASAAHASEYSKSAASQQNIVQGAASADNLKTLVAAVEAAGLVETLSGAGPFTVFAPTDDAFARLPAGTVEIPSPKP